MMFRQASKENALPWPLLLPRFADATSSQDLSRGPSGMSLTSVSGSRRTFIDHIADIYKPSRHALCDGLTAYAVSKLFDRTL